MILSQDDPHAIVDAMLAVDYDEEFCLALEFDPPFVARLMKAGFLVMSTFLEEDPSDSGPSDSGPSDQGPSDQSPAQYILLPKLHLERSVLLFPELHVKKSIRPFLSRYELRVDGVPASELRDMRSLFALSPGPDSDFGFIMERCVEVHDDAWLTAPLRRAIGQIHADPDLPVRPISFGVYRDGILKAGEFGILAGKVYTSYSGYYDEDNAGMVQLVLTAKYLESLGAPFWDLGMPLDYKDLLGARNIDPFQFVELFRNGQL
ncbi:leucyl-tRNA--protein transferase [Treponema primitia]|uniref:leucyl-tRNA--protein transferase n=1 Tax=Treponema primitia TaxID=88058 RepID=UPI0002555577|nr:leucyl-tRNA--protein transferase [Treponema primitia]